MKANKAYRFRIYPDTEQQIQLTRTFGCVRFVYNRLLEEKIGYYEKSGKLLRNTPAHLKAKYEWLKEADSLALANAQLQLESAYRKFFQDKTKGYPKYKSRKSGKQSYTTNNQKGSVRIEGRKIKLPKIGWVRIVQHRQIAEGHEIKSVTVNREASGKYYVSILTEYEKEPIEAELDPEKALGLDYSSPHFYVDSENHAADMPQFYREAEKRLAAEQRKLSRMEKGGKNYGKQKVKVAKAYEKVRNARKDWQHKESTRLADSWDYICVEDINYQDMAKGLRLSKATNDNAFGQFRTMLAYKLEERGKKLITIDKWYPSTKTCRHCGHIHEALTLKDREWNCPNCGAYLQRDYNAAINIRNRGLAIEQ